MSKFRVGQRVRIVHVRNPSEGTIVEANPRCGEFASNGLINMADADWLVEQNRPGVWGLFDSWQLEPATDCYDKTEWDACVWKPEHLRVGA